MFADIVMAGRLDGRDLARIVRSRWPSVKVVLTSGFPGANHRRDIDTLEDVPLLTKPYRRNDLAQTLRRTLDDRQG